MKKYILGIDTSDNRKTTVWISSGKKVLAKRLEENTWSSQIVLPLIDRILKEKEITWQEVSEISVHQGPGSYTGLRVGVAIANVLGWIWGIPVNGKRKPVLPRYD